MGGGHLGTSGGMGCPTHVYMHVHACTHMFTCIEIANGH